MLVHVNLRRKYRVAHAPQRKHGHIHEKVNLHRVLELKQGEDGDSLQGKYDQRCQHISKMRKTYTRNMAQNTVSEPKWLNKGLLQRRDSNLWFWKQTEKKNLFKLQDSLVLATISLQGTQSVSAYCIPKLLKLFLHGEKLPIWY